jgi:hypothetical protein
MAQARLRRGRGAPRWGPALQALRAFRAPHRTPRTTKCPGTSPRHSPPPSRRPDSAASGRHRRARQGRSSQRLRVHTPCTAGSPPRSWRP